MNPQPSRPVLLTGYDAKRCARRIHNEWDPALEKVEWEVPADLQLRFDLGIEFEAGIFNELKACVADSAYVDLTEVRGKAEATAATVQAMDAGTHLILGGWLPDDPAGGRTGRPDLLLRVDGGYVPGDVKAHKVVARRAKGRLTYSTFANPTEPVTVGGWSAETSSRLDDYLQLAHYWRMLEAIDQAPDRPAIGFIIGRDDLTDLTSGGHVLTWLDLSVQLFETYSRSRGKAKRSALERYDHEQAFRLVVAKAAAAGEPALVKPIFTDECDACPWYDHCRGVAGVDVASAQIKSGRLSVREWNALASAGVLNLDQLADLSVDDEAFRTEYLPEVTHVRDPLGRLAAAVRRAGMIRDGVVIERETTGSIAVPRADIEIDLDIEWDPGDRVYLWGALVKRPGVEPAYHPVVAWEELDDESELRLAREFNDWLRGQVSQADASGQSLLVYHYASPEPTYLKRLLGESEVADLLPRFVDLLAVVRQHYFGLYGLGIKKVAPAFGFDWRDEAPGGLQSQLWLLEARGSDDEATRIASRKRILDYNEDDVRATSAVRNGL